MTVIGRIIMSYFLVIAKISIREEDIAMEYTLLKALDFKS